VFAPGRGANGSPPPTAPGDSMAGSSTALSVALRIALAYLLLGVLWILLSDRVLLAMVEDPGRLTWLQTAKGWFFVALSGAMVFGLVYRTLRLRSEEAARDRRLRTVLDTIPSRVAWKGRDGRYQGCNAAFAADAGLSHPREIRGRTDGELPWAEEAPAIAAADRKVVESGKTLRRNAIPVEFPPGQLRWVDHWRVPVRGPNGEVEGILFCYDDVTNRISTRLQLQQAQRVQEVGRLTSGLVHDFRNVLAVIRANTDLLRGNGLHGEEAGEAFRDIQQASDAAQGVVRKLLGLSRKADLAVAERDLASVLSGLSPMLSRLLRHAHPFRVELAEDLPPVRCDVGAVEQIVLNLVTNARDAMAGSGGEILLTLEARRWTPNPSRRVEGSRVIWIPPHEQLPPAGRYVALSVSDQGPGIPAEVLPRVFEPFFTTKQDGVGTGLGLSMVQGLMEQHGGAVEVETEAGSGTTIRLLFPEARSRAEKPRPDGVDPCLGGEAEGDAAPIAEKATILVVEDQPDLRRTLLRVLRHAGYEVIEASDGPAGLELARAHRGGIDLILSDLALPGFGGMTLFRTLRTEGIDTPFAITTGMADLEGAAETPEEAAIPVIPKPWTVKELSRAVREVLAGSHLQGA
jgi:signal transduction histidine kinase/ActR/RegA family two-component response regulator